MTTKRARFDWTPSVEEQMKRIGDYMNSLSAEITHIPDKINEEISKIHESHKDIENRLETLQTTLMQVFSAVAKMKKDIDEKHEEIINSIPDSGAICDAIAEMR